MAVMFARNMAFSELFSELDSLGGNYDFYAEKLLETSARTATGI